MHVLLIVIGLLLALFGGGCVAFVAVLAIADTRSFISSLWETMPLVSMFGLLPLAAGLVLFRFGMKIDRDKRKKVADDFRNIQKGPR
jgi:integral membrane sensor domain MASE1